MANAQSPAEAKNSGTKSMKVLLTRNLTIVEDKNATRSVYTGVATVDQIVDIDTSENVRGYIAATGSETKVHRAIRDSLEKNPADFHVLNGGLTIVAEGSTWDEATRQLILVNPSLINGGQTQGVIKDFLKDRAKRFEAEPDQEMSALPSVHFQLIVTEDKTLVADISSPATLKTASRPSLSWAAKASSTNWQMRSSRPDLRCRSPRTRISRPATTCRPRS
jgi:hypothetical protein